MDALAAEISGARIVGDSSVEVASLAYDSRKVGPGTLFFCVPGEKVDGHEFAAGAVEARAVAELFPFTNLDQQLAEVWSSVVKDVGDQLQCQVDPVELAIDWHLVHEILLDGLRDTAFKRYLSWFGEGRYRKLKAKMQGAKAAFKPRKRVRTA